MAWRAFALGLCLLACGVPQGAAARAFTVDDLLKQEGFGSVVLDPTGRYAVVERRGPYDSAASFDGQHRNRVGASRLLLSNLAGDPTGRPLMAQPDGYGYLAGPWAPDGRRIAVFRLSEGSWELGVATPAAGDVTWLGLTPASNARGQSVVWRSADALLVLARPPEDGPWELRLGSQSARRLPQRWAAAAAGHPAVTVIGSGAYLQSAPRPQPTKLIEIDMLAGARRTRASGAFIDMELDPSGRRLALLETGARLQPAEGRSPQGEYGTATEAVHLALIDLATDAVSRPCPPCDLLNTLLSWSPSGDRLLVFARQPEAPWTAGAFHVYAPQTRQLRPLPISNIAPALRYRPERIETGWLGEDPLVRARTAGQRSGRADWWVLRKGGAVNLTASLPSEPSALVVTGPTVRVLAGDRLWRVAASSAAPVQNADGVAPIAIPDVAPGQRQAVVARRDPAQLLFRAKAGGLQLADGRSVAVNVASEEALAGFSSRLSGLLVFRTDPHGVAQLELRRPDRPPATIAEINRSLADTDVPMVLPITHKGPQGQVLKSWLYLPPAAASDGPPPLVIWPYLGDNHPKAPAPKPAILNFAVNPRILVGHGYAVLIPSLPLPMSDRTPLAGIGDRLLGIVEAAARQAPGTFDDGRLALWGHSYGGYTTLGAISQSDRFKAAIAMAAPSDLISHGGAFQVGQRVSPEDGVWPAWGAAFSEDIQGRMGAPPWRAAERYIRNSPIFHVETIRTPVLLIHGDQDAIGIGQSEEMFSALFRLRRDAELVTYWGEGHIISSPGNVRDLYARALRWLDRYLAADKATCSRPPCGSSGT